LTDGSPKPGKPISSSTSFNEVRSTGAKSVLRVVGNAVATGKIDRRIAVTTFSLSMAKE